MEAFLAENHNDIVATTLTLKECDSLEGLMEQCPFEPVVLFCVLEHFSDNELKRLIALSAGRFGHPRTHADLVLRAVREILAVCVSVKELKSCH